MNFNYRTYLMSNEMYEHFKHWLVCCTILEEHKGSKVVRFTCYDSSIMAMIDRQALRWVY